MRQAIVGLGLLVMVACGGGGGSPTSPSVVPPVSAPPPSGWPAGTIVQLVNGDSGNVVSGTLIVAGATVPVGAPLAAAAGNGATVDVSAPGFLPRQTLVRTGETRLLLWPDSSGLPADYTRSLVYTTVPASPGILEVLISMRRLPTRTRTIAVVPSAAIQNDPEAMEAHRAAIDGLNAATAPLGVSYRLGGAGDLSIPTQVDPALGSCVDHSTRAFTNLWLSSAEITRAEINYCGTAISSTVGTIVHELGHSFGLLHSLDPNDMMYPYARSSRAVGPTAREALTIGLMRGRRAGTQWPDNDRNAIGAAGTRVETVVD
jgi:hypothetical protein